MSDILNWLNFNYLLISKINYILFKKVKIINMSSFVLKTQAKRIKTKKPINRHSITDFNFT